MTKTKEIKLGETYTDRYKQVTGPAMEIYASAGGCFQVALQLPPKEDGEPGKALYSFDTHLDDEKGNPMRVSDTVVKRTAEVLGKQYRHPASALTGIAEGVRFMENGTEQISIQPKGDGKKKPPSWMFDACLLEEIADPIPVAAAPRIGAPSAPSPTY